MSLLVTLANRCALLFLALALEVDLATGSGELFCTKFWAKWSSNDCAATGSKVAKLMALALLSAENPTVSCKASSPSMAGISTATINSVCPRT